MKKGSVLVISIIFIVIIIGIIVGVILFSNGNNNGGKGNAVIYVTFVSHNERNTDTGTGERLRYGDMRASQEGYEKFRNSLIEIADMINKYGFKYSYQTDYMFLDGIELYEDKVLAENPDKTNGKEILNYLSEDLGVSIEPHAHECLNTGVYMGSCVDKKYNYADVAYLIKKITGITPAPVIGGSTASERSIEEWSNCIDALSFDYKWCPQILTVFAGAQSMHKGTDDFSSGIWKPKDLEDNFLINNPSGKITYVGSGMHFNEELSGAAESTVDISSVEYIKELISKIESGEIPDDKIYTATIIILEENMINSNNYDYLEDTLKELQKLKQQGKIIPATYPDVVNIWKTQYNSEPNTYTIEDFGVDNGAGTSTQGKCGDGTCDSIESKNNVCPEDCQTGNNNINSDLCGDGTCDEIEQRMGVCPEDCSGTISSEGKIGYVGCSVTLNSMKGYQELGGDEFWTGNPDYPGGDFGTWAEDLTDNSKYWNSFQDFLDNNPNTEKIWWMICAKEANEDKQTYDNAVKIFNEIKRRAPNKKIYVSVMPDFPDHECSITGKGYYEDLQTITDELVNNNGALEGPEMGPLTNSLVSSDGCHGNSEGEKLLGQQLIDFFG